VNVRSSIGYDSRPKRSGRSQGPLLSECSENPLKFRQCESRIFAAFRDVTRVFLKYRVSEQKATSYIGVGGGDKMTKIQGKSVSKRVAIYLRVSTAEQTITNQRRELHALPP
jgi:hypothetical protein